MVDDLELQPGLAAVVARTLAAAQLILPAGHDEQARVRAPEDAVEIRGLQKRLERDLLLSGDGAVRGRRQRVHPLPALVRSVVFLPLRVELGARRVVLLQPRVEGVHLRLQRVGACTECLTLRLQRGDVRRRRGVCLRVQRGDLSAQLRALGLRRSVLLLRRVKCLPQRLVLRLCLCERGLRRIAVRVRQLGCTVGCGGVQFVAARGTRGAVGLTGPDRIALLLQLRLLL